MANSFPEKAADAVSGIKEAAVADAENAKARVSAVYGDMKERASGAANTALTFAEAQKTKGADALHGIAGMAKNAGESLEPHLPSAAKVVKNVASSVDQASKDLHAQSIDKIGASVAKMAREQPVAALAAAFVAGILITRAFSSR